MRAETLVVVAGLAVMGIGFEAGEALAASADLCARCHETQVALEASTGGHAPGLDCLSCHRDRRPGRFGRRHRTSVRCASHHGETRHPPRRRAQKATRACLGCHDVHGSPNLSLVRTQIAIRRVRLAEVRFTSEAGSAPGGFTDPTAPGSGVCEVCHRQTDFFRADGSGEPHFTESCVLCHDHAVGFRPVVSDANCTICHAAEGERFAKPSLHASRFACSDCHAEVTVEAAPGHRAVAPCADCHENRTHAPPGAAPFACVQCHDPHGTDNVKLVLDTITTTAGAERPIRFDNLLGRVDGSFASASVPGTGVCEVCHTATRFYRADGSGEAHFTFSCLPCHPHSTGFTPR